MSFIKKAIVTMFLVFVCLSVGLQLFARPTGEYSEIANSGECYWFSQKTNQCTNKKVRDQYV